MGGDMNGATGYESTIFILDLPAFNWMAGLDIMHRVVCTPNFTQAHLEHEKRVTHNELPLDTPPLGLWLRRLGMLCGLNNFSPYMLWRNFDRTRTLLDSVGGYERTRRKITLADVQTHYKHWYTPNAMNLVVVGDFQPEALAWELEHTWGVMPAPASSLAVYLPSQPIPPARRWRAWRVTVDREFEQMFCMPYGGVATYSPAVLSLLRSLVDDRLSNRLRHQLGWLYKVDVTTSGYSDVGLLFVNYLAPYKHIRALEQEVVKIFNELAAGQIAEADFQRVRTMRLGMIQLSRQYNANYRDHLLDHFPLPPGEPLSPIMQTLPEVSLEAVQAMARRLFTPGNRHAYVYQPDFLRSVILVLLWVFGYGVLVLSIAILLALGIVAFSRLLGF